MGRLDGKVAVVTGGANGIGRACCERFAEEGADVVIGDVQPADATVAAVVATGRRAVARRLDAASAESNTALMQVAVDELGGLDVLVTAAGISHAAYRSGDVANDLARFAELGPRTDTARQFTEFPLEAWQAVLDVNLTGTLKSLQACVGAMLDHGCERDASLITIASIAAKHPDAGSVPYGASKAGVWYLTKKLARDLAPAGIRVNSIGPGFIETNMTAIMQFMPDAARRNIERQIPMGRMGTPREIANTALFLASDEASYFTGEILHPDGGFYTE